MWIKIKMGMSSKVNGGRIFSILKDIAMIYSKNSNSINW